MAQAPIVTANPFQAPLLTKDGALSYTWLIWFQNIGNALNAAINSAGQVIGGVAAGAIVSAQAFFGTRSEDIGTTLQNIDDTGAILGPGIDFSRPYINKNTDNIADGTGSPLAGGKEAYIALITSAPSPGDLLEWNGTQWVALPAPASLSKVTSEWLDSYNSATGAFTQSQPAYTDLSGRPALPVNDPAVAHQWLNSYNSTTGAFTQTQPAVADVTGAAPSASPTFTGTVTQPAPTVLTAATTATTATAGAGTALPATPVAYLSVSINGTTFKIPYYAV